MEFRELELPPSLAPLYARAALGVLPGGGGDAPAYGYELDGARAETGRVAAYSRVCGFTVRSTLPATYPHILGFPLAMKLMTDRAFPFAVVGAVHVANRISQRRAIPIDAALRIRVWADNLRPHHRGRQLDLVTEATLDGEAAWVERSTYLRVGEGSGERPERDADPLEGAPVAAVWNVPGDIGRRYAAVSGDRNPIHLHAVSARAFGFPGAIAHGMWTYGKALAALNGKLAEEHTSEVFFRAPLRIPGRARLLNKGGPDGWDLALDAPDGERRHLLLAVRDGTRLRDAAA